jgi:hypothetical protein
MAPHTSLPHPDRRGGAVSAKSSGAQEDRCRVIAEREAPDDTRIRGLVKVEVRVDPEKLAVRDDGTVGCVLFDTE